MVEVALFNINDISLLFSGFLAMVLACLLFFSRPNGRIRKMCWLFFALLLVLGAMCVIDTQLWDMNLRSALPILSADFFFIFFMMFFLQGCLLLCFTRSHIFCYFPLKNFGDFSRRKIEQQTASEPTPDEPQQQLVEKLTDFMEHSKPYLEPHITVERLAIKLNVSPKLLSCTINSQMQMNFFELISTYRVAEAKKRLADAELRQKPISEIMKSCGFNSKSVFNQAFKKTVGVTPSLYRQQHLPE